MEVWETSSSYPAYGRSTRLCFRVCASERPQHHYCTALHVSPYLNSWPLRVISAIEAPQRWCPKVEVWLREDHTKQSRAHKVRAEFHLQSRATRCKQPSSEINLRRGSFHQLSKFASGFVPVRDLNAFEFK